MEETAVIASLISNELGRRAIHISAGDAYLKLYEVASLLVKVESLIPDSAWEDNELAFDLEVEPQLGADFFELKELPKPQEVADLMCAMIYEE